MASFCTLKEALEVDWTTEKAKAGMKRTPVDYFMLHGTERIISEKSKFWRILTQLYILWVMGVYFHFEAINVLKEQKVSTK